jgi:hypothetical protein
MSRNRKPDGSPAMRSIAWAITLTVLSSGLVAGAEGPPPVRGVPPLDARPLLIRPGQSLVLRVRQVIPCDALSPGERILNGRPPLMARDRFLAEVVADPGAAHVIVGGTITRIHPPRRFRRAGHVEVEIAQLVAVSDGSAPLGPWRVDLDDRRFGTHLHRALLAVFFGLEGADVGASIGAQLAQGNPGYIGGGAGIGLLVGLGYATLQRGPEGTLEPGDTFQIVLGTCSCRPLPRTVQMTLYPPKHPAPK